jgi:hypothetical protein
MERGFVGCGPQVQPRGYLDGGCGGFDVFLAKDELGIAIGILVNLERFFGRLGIVLYFSTGRQYSARRLEVHLSAWRLECEIKQDGIV